MDIKIEDKDNIHVIALSGRVDASNAPDLDAKLEEFMKTASLAVVLDLSAVEYMSSAGLRSVLRLGKLCTQKKLFLGCCSLQANVAEVFKISGFATIIKLFDTFDDAKNAI